ncbi:hypothetical protein HDV05_003764 [Chytridiales sp. JEL 0842]|nr:hypothetical protein HDV05_003764 [Chytridiales sp. JEL 0842]
MLLVILSRLVTVDELEGLLSTETDGILFAIHPHSLHFNDYQPRLLSILCDKETWLDHKVSSVFCASVDIEDRTLATSLSADLDVPLLNTNTALRRSADRLDTASDKHGLLVTVAVSAQQELHALSVSSVSPGSSADSFESIDITLAIEPSDDIIISRALVHAKQAIAADIYGVFHIFLSTKSQQYEIFDWEGLPFLLSFARVTDVNLLQVRHSLIKNLQFPPVKSINSAKQALRYVHLRPGPLYLERSDYVSLRLQLAQTVEKTFSSTNLTDSLKICKERQLAGFLHGSVGSILSTPSSNPISDLNKSFKEREFDLPVCAQNPLENNHLVVLDAGWSKVWRQHHLMTWAALGYKITVLDRPGHWISKPFESKIPTRFQIHSFIAMDTTPDAGLCQRILEALKDVQEPINGISTMSDDHLVPVAEAARALGLPTGNPELYALCANKDKFRQLSPIKGAKTHFVADKEGLLDLIEKGEVEFPAIVKPCRGAGSVGVFRVDSGADLVRVWDSHVEGAMKMLKAGGVLVERYVNGPEVDVNLVLQNGEVVYEGISDQDSCEGDENSNDVATNTFAEPKAYYPSTLPQDDQNLLLETCIDTVKNKLGFQTGVFHIECRLDPKHNSVAIIEVNARTPGFFIPDLLTRSHGIDLACAMYHQALGRDAKAVLKRFEVCPFYLGVHPMRIMKGGVMMSEDIFAGVRGLKNVVNPGQFFGKGSIVPEPRPGMLFVLGRYEVVGKSVREVRRVMQDVYELLDIRIEPKRKQVSVIIPSDDMKISEALSLPEIAHHNLETLYVYLVRKGHPLSLRLRQDDLPSSNFVVSVVDFLSATPEYEFCNGYEKDLPLSVLCQSKDQAAISYAKSMSQHKASTSISILSDENISTPSCTLSNGNYLISIVVSAEITPLMFSRIHRYETENQVVMDLHLNPSDVFSTHVEEILELIKQSKVVEGQDGVFHVEVSVEENGVFEIAGCDNDESVSFAYALLDCTSANVIDIRTGVTKFSSATTALIAQGSRILRIINPTEDASANSLLLQRADYISTRFLETHKEIEWVSTFTTMHEYMESRKSFTPQTPLKNAYAYILTKPFESHSDASTYLTTLFNLRNFSLPMVPLSEPNVRDKKLVFIGGGFNLSWRLHLLSVIAALGIKAIIMDNPGHWMTDQDKHKVPQHIQAYMFRPLDMKPDGHLNERIVEAVRKLQSEGEIFDGVTTINDELLVQVAMAAHQLGYVNNPVESLQSCVDKSKTRQIAPIRGMSGFVLKTRDDALQLATDTTVTYPLIMKTQSGSGSNGVVKVYDGEDLLIQWDKLFAGLIKNGSTGVLVEPYVKGQEIDVNMVIHNGELVFYEINDQDPCQGDGDDRETCRTFLEYIATYPETTLSASERTTAQTFCLDVIKRLGFTTGVYHVEARMDRFQDPTTCAIMEVNARTPGFRIPQTVSRVHGVDYLEVTLAWALGMDVRKYTRPFKRNTSWIRLIVPPTPPGGGYMEVDNIFERVKNHKNVTSAVQFFKRGDYLPDPATSGRVFWMGRLEIVSHVSAEELDEATREIVPKLYMKLSRDPVL